MEFITAEKITEERWRDFFNSLIEMCGKRNAFISKNEHCIVEQKIASNDIFIPAKILDELDEAGWKVCTYKSINKSNFEECTVIILDEKESKK
jgi:hypothetical protein